MKLKFKHQKFQQDAAAAVCDVFAGQPKITRNKYIMDIGDTRGQETIDDGTAFNNAPLVISDTQILKNLQRVQRANDLRPDDKLDGRYNLTVEMETGTGKTYTYIKTMYELNARYGWCKFIIVVPSIAIREGVYKSFQIMQSDFASEYHKKIRFFIYNSDNLSALDNFASDSGINVMIINAQAFNARGKNARRINMRLDDFRSRRPIDVLAKTNPILIIDEPQSVEGKQTKERLKDFNALFTLRYSATPRDPYNMVYRLDAMEAYNKHLVKKIAVKGITVTGSTGTEGYMYLQQINVSKKTLPIAVIEHEVLGKSGHKKVVRKVDRGYDFYEKSGGMEQYKGYEVADINGYTNTVEFTNGKILSVGDVVGAVSEEQLRRIQIRETILSHLEKEKELFYDGIKVLSLFFIDEVAKYREYDKDDTTGTSGIYARIFEEEYNNILSSMQQELEKDEYYDYLYSIKAAKTHKGYFSVDKKHKSKFVDSKLNDKKAGTTDDVEAYDLIMKNKERLLSRKEPVRFIFSHSALREGWDNPNIFQICTLKQSGSSEIRKRQEVGRGLRLSVNEYGDRMDEEVLGSDVHQVNVLTVIANESYEKFAKGLQEEMAEVIADRPREVDDTLFNGRTMIDTDGNTRTLDNEDAKKIVYSMTVNGYLDYNKKLTDKYYDDRSSGKLDFTEEFNGITDGIVDLLDSIYNPEAIKPQNARENTAETTINQANFARKEFKELWKQINRKSAYIVKFDTEELVEKAIDALNLHLRVSQVFFKIESGELERIESKEKLSEGSAFKKRDSDNKAAAVEVKSSVKYDLIGKLVQETGLTRRTVADILKGIEPTVFSQFAKNPEEFILRAANLINEQKATVIIEHITYNLLDETYDDDIFTDHTLKGKLGYNAISVDKSIFNNIVYDSKNEESFVKKLDAANEVVVYAKLPSGFYINTPVGKYNPDWAIAFKDETVKHIYFVAETKGSLSTLSLRGVEELKIHCAREHFRAISSDAVKYDVVDSYEELLNIVMR